jgi:hypothetical protein
MFYFLSSNRFRLAPVDACERQTATNAVSSQRSARRYTSGSGFEFYFRSESQTLAGSCGIAAPNRVGSQLVPAKQESNQTKINVIPNDDNKKTVKSIIDN